MIVSKFILQWRGSEVLTHMQSACIEGINHTMTDCVSQAKTLVRVSGQGVGLSGLPTKPGPAPGTLRNSITLQPAKMEFGTIKGEWGSFTCNYAIYQEIGPVTMSRLWAFTPYLRPSSQTHYPQLAGNIREAFGES